MLAGDKGEAATFAMRILVKLGALYGAKEFQSISQVHVDGCCYQTAGDAGLDFAEKLAAMGAKVVVPTTTNVSGRDIQRWREFRFPEALAEKCRRMEEAYLAMGAIPTWTCAPYLAGPLPRFGEQIVWAESNAIAYVNSVIGARTHRYGDFVDACAAVTGRTPRFGLHLPENRHGSVLVRLRGFGPERAYDTSLFGLLGYWLGKTLGSRIPVIEGVPQEVTADCLKALSAAGAASGSLALFHVVGVTPEAPTARQALGGRKPAEALTVTPADLAETRNELTTTGGEEVDLVALGCPHFSYAEAWGFLRALGGRRVAKGVECFVYTNRAVLGALESTGLAAELAAAGVRLATDTCILHWPLADWSFRAMATNSGKFAKYAPGLIGMEVKYCALAQCAEAAATGRVAA
jgi:predicted aconitase